MSDDIQKETERIHQGIVESLSFSEALAQRDAEIKRLQGILEDVCRWHEQFPVQRVRETPGESR